MNRPWLTATTLAFCGALGVYGASLGFGGWSASAQTETEPAEASAEILAETPAPAEAQAATTAPEPSAETPPVESSTEAPSAEAPPEEPPAPTPGGLNLSAACPRFQVIWGVADEPPAPARRFCACVSQGVARLAESYPDMPVTAAALNFAGLDPVAAQAAEEAYSSGAAETLLSRRVYGFAVFSAAAEACAPPLEGEEADPLTIEDEDEAPEGFEPPEVEAP